MALTLPDPKNYDTETKDRDESYVEALAHEFAEAEQSILHDVYPESDDEAEQQRRRGNRERVDTKIRRGDGLMNKGQKFYNGIAFKECVTDYALLTGYNLKQYRYDKDRIGFKCVGAKGKCEWKVYAACLHNESPTKKKPKHKKRIMHCGICGSDEHSSRFHKKKNQSQASLGELCQGSIT